MLSLYACLSTGCSTLCADRSVATLQASERQCPVFVVTCYRTHIWHGKTRMAGLQSGEGRTMINSVIWAQYINVTDTHTDSHVTTATATLTRCVRATIMILASPFRLHQVG